MTWQQAAPGLSSLAPLASGSLGVSDGSVGDEDKASGTIVEREGGIRVQNLRSASKPLRNQDK